MSILKFVCIFALSFGFFAARAEIGIIDPEAGKVAEEIDDDTVPWLGKGIAACTVDDRLLEKDANAMGYYYAQKIEDRKNFKKGYDTSVAKYRVSKLECLQKVFTTEYGQHLKLKTAVIFSDFREALSRLKSWGAYFQAQQEPVCPQHQLKTCAEYMTRQQRDAQMGWAMQRLAVDLEEQIKISTKTELGEAFERANRNLPKKN